MQKFSSFYFILGSSGEKLPHISCPQCSSTLEIASSDLSVHQHDLEAVHKEAENEVYNIWKKRFFG